MKSSVLQLVYGTTNTGKIAHMESMLTGLPISILPPDAFSHDIPHIEETGATPLENAIIKADRYFELCNVPVFACDSGLYFENYPEEEQPGVFIRRVAGKAATDEEMIEHYARLAKRNGGSITARYHNAVSLIISRNERYDEQSPGLYSEQFILTDKPCTGHRKGLPLDSLSKDIRTGKYFLEKTDFRVDHPLARGFRYFFQRSLKL